MENLNISWWILYFKWYFWFSIDVNWRVLNFNWYFMNYPWKWFRNYIKNFYIFILKSTSMFESWLIKCLSRYTLIDLWIPLRPCLTCINLHFSCYIYCRCSFTLQSFVENWLRHWTTRWTLLVRKEIWIGFGIVYFSFGNFSALLKQRTKRRSTISTFTTG